MKSPDITSQQLRVFKQLYAENQSQGKLRGNLQGYEQVLNRIGQLDHDIKKKRREVLGIGDKERAQVHQIDMMKFAVNSLQKRPSARGQKDAKAEEQGLLAGRQRQVGSFMSPSGPRKAEAGNANITGNNHSKTRSSIAESSEDPGHLPRAIHLTDQNNAHRASVVSKINLNAVADYNEKQGQLAEQSTKRRGQELKSIKQQLLDGVLRDSIRGDELEESAAPKAAARDRSTISNNDSQDQALAGGLENFAKKHEHVDEGEQVGKHSRTVESKLSKKLNCRTAAKKAAAAKQRVVIEQYARQSVMQADVATEKEPQSST